MATENPDWETAALEATIAKLTARSPDKLFVTDSDRALERFEKELVRQIAKHTDADEDPDELLDNVVFDNDDADPIVETDVYPRNAGIASGFYQALKAIRLPSGARIYFESGEWESHKIRAIAGRDLDAEAAARLGEIRGLPTYYRVGDHLLEIDEHLSAVSAGGWILEELFDHEAGWIQQDDLDRAEERRAELQRAIDEAAEEDDAPEEQLDHAQAVLDATPPWFLLLDGLATRRNSGIPTSRARPVTASCEHVLPLDEADPRDVPRRRQSRRPPAHRRRLPGGAVTRRSSRVA